jgi:hypothetical protein
MLLFAIGATGGAFSSSAVAQEDAKLTTAIGALADDIRAYLNGAGVQECSLGAMSSVPPGGVATVPVKNLLSKELENRGIRMNRAAKFSCTGEVRFNESSKRLVVDVKIHEKGNLRKICTTEISKVTDLAQLVGPTGQFEIGETRNTSILESITNPQGEAVESPPLEQKNAIKALPAVAGAAVRPKSVATPGKASFFGVEILRVLPDGVLEPVVLEDELDGNLFASLEVGDIYAIRLINKSNRLAGARLTIDGLNLLAFSENQDYARIGRVIVPPGETGTIVRGWHKSDRESYSFKVVDVGDSAVAELKGGGAGLLEVDDSIGMINVTFCFAADANNPNDRLPDDEPLTLSTATAKGPIVKQDFRPMKAVFGAERATITIRYDRRPPAAE